MNGALTVSPDTTTITDVDILCFPVGHPQAGMPMARFEEVPDVINKVDVSFDYNVPGLREGDFGRRLLYTAHRSVDRHLPQRVLSIPLRGLRLADGGQTLADALALSIMQRYGFPAWLLHLSASFRAHTLRVGETVHVSSDLIENPITGEVGLTHESFEVLAVTTPLLLNGRTDLILLWTGAIESSAAPVGELVNLVPGISSFDNTDVAIPFAGSATVTTTAGTKSVRLGFKHQTYRLWHCELIPKIATFNGEKFLECNGVNGPVSYVNRTYKGQVSYRVEYKTSGAADQPGTGGDPTTGWVPLSNRSWAFTGEESDDRITAPGHQLQAGQRVYLTGASLPGGLSAHTIYYVRDNSGDTFRLSATYFGPAIGLTADGSGTVHEASKVRGTVALAAKKDCQASDIHPAAPAEDNWSEFFEALAAGAGTYNCKVFFDSVSQQADPCSALNVEMCNASGCPGGSLQASVMHTDQKDLDIDFVESVT